MLHEELPEEIPQEPVNELPKPPPILTKATGLLLAGLRPRNSCKNSQKLLGAARLKQENPLDSYVFSIEPAPSGNTWAAPVRHLASGELKILKRVTPESLDELNSVKGEIALSQSSIHANVLNYYEFFNYDRSLWIVSEYFPFTLSDLLVERAGIIHEKHMAYICKQVLAGLAFLHRQERIHRDLKSNNVLINLDGDVKLGDFGHAAQLLKNDLVGNPAWMAPELIQQETYSEAVDVWALGILVLELAEGRPPYVDCDRATALEAIVNNPAPTFKHRLRWSEDLRSFTGQCLQKNPETRATVWHLLRHPFIEYGVGETSKQQFGELLAECTAQGELLVPELAGQPAN